MLPLLASLKPEALVSTATPASKRQAKRLLPLLCDMPPDLQRRLVELATDGAGVPLLLVRKVVYTRDAWSGALEVMDRKDESMCYIRLPDPTEGPLDEDRFETSNYPFAEFLGNFVEYVNYGAASKQTLFVRVDPAIDNIAELAFESYDDGPRRGYVDDFVNAALADADVAAKDRTWFAKNYDGEQLLYKNLPTFKSHVAIVLSLESVRNMPP